MPFYDYFCERNGQTVEVEHGAKKVLKTWGEVCQAAGISPGDTPVRTPVQRLISAPQIQTSPGDSRLKELGFTKLVRKDKGVYENVTASGKEKRIVKASDPSSMPHLNKKIKD